MKYILFCFSISFILIFQTQIFPQDESSAIYYNIISQNRIYLWSSLEDQQQVYAEKKNGDWEISPEGIINSPQWKSKLSSFSFNRNASIKTSWQNFLNKLDARELDTISTKPRYPDILIYYINLNDTEEIIFISKTYFEVFDFVYSEKKDIWQKNIDIPLSKILGTSELNAGIKSILKLQSKPKNKKDWDDVWSNLINNFNSGNDKYRSVYYHDSLGNYKWCWQEKITNSDLIYKLNAHVPIKKIVIEEEKSNLLVWILGFGLIVSVSFVIFVVFRNRKTDKKLYSNNESNKKIDDFFKQFFDKIGNNRNDKQEKRKYYVFTYWIKSLNELVKEFEDLIRMKENEIYNLSLKPDEGKYESLFKEHNKTLDNLNRIESIRKNLEDEKGKLSNEKENLERMLKEKNEECSRLVGSLNKTEDMKKEYLEINKKNKNELDDRNKRIKEMSEEVIKINTNLNLSDKKLREVDTIMKISSNFSQGQRNYFDNVNDIAGAAIVSFLINYSLFQLCRSIITDKDKLKYVMLNNLLKISNTFNNEIRGFNNAYVECQKIFDTLNNINLRIEESTESHNDDKIFQAFINYLRNSRKTNLAPFYFDIDKNGKINRAL